MKSRYLQKHLFLNVFIYLPWLTFELQNSVVPFFRQTQDQEVATKKTAKFDTVIELDITGKWVFSLVFDHLWYVPLHLRT